MIKDLTLCFVACLVGRDFWLLDGVSRLAGGFSFIVGFSLFILFILGEWKVVVGGGMSWDTVICGDVFLLLNFFIGVRFTSSSFLLASSPFSNFIKVFFCFFFSISMYSSSMFFTCLGFLLVFLVPSSTTFISDNTSFLSRENSCQDVCFGQQLPLPDLRLVLGLWLPCNLLWAALMVSSVPWLAGRRCWAAWAALSVTCAGISLARRGIIWSGLLRRGGSGSNIASDLLGQ